MIAVRLLSLYWQQGMAYRASVILWRFRQLMTTATALFIWLAVYQSTDSVLGYTKDQMITYTLLTSLLQSVILATALNNLPGLIYRGDITTKLLKPFWLFYDFWLEDMADKLKNCAFALVETALLLLVLQPSFIMPDWSTLAVWIALLACGVWINFCITLLFGAIGFWSPDAWGPRFFFYMIVEFTAGKFYPLDILPQWVQVILLSTPFPYLSYWQTQLWLDRLSPHQVAAITIGAFFWSYLLWKLTQMVWKTGLKSYSATGN